MSLHSADNGARFNWNLFPSTRLEATHLGTPLGCLYSPLHANATLTAIPEAKNAYACDTCGSYMNPYIKLDRANGMWWCPFCEKRSFLLAEFAQSIPESAGSSDDWPVELRQSSAVVEYDLPEDVSTTTPADLPLAYTIILDLYEYVDDRGTEPAFPSLLASLGQAVDLLPVGSLISILTYDEVVHVHRFDNNPVSFSGSFVGEDLFSDAVVSTVLERLGVSSELPYEWAQSSLLTEGYFLQLSDSNRDFIKAKIMSLVPTPTSTHKAVRSSGLAHYLSAIMLNRASYRNFVGKTLHFISGPCTNFPGKIVSTNETIRSHNDISELNAPHFATSSKFYKTLGYIANGQTIQSAHVICSSVSSKTTSYYVNPVSPTWSVSLFTGSPDQVGTYEMKPLVSSTMGQIHLFSSFCAFQLPTAIAASIRSISYKNKLTVATSAGLKISKLVGDVGYALPSSYKIATYHQKIADTLTKFDSSTIKNIFTNQWQFNALTDETICILFEMDTVKSSRQILTAPKQVYVQFQLRYWDSESRKWKLRVTTCVKNTTASVEKPDIRQAKLLESIDQECFVVLLARLLINKIDTTLGFDKFDNMIKVLDDTIVKLLYHFGGDGGAAASNSNPYLRDHSVYQLNEMYAQLPALVYNLRRNAQLIRIFNSSPDETAMYHSWFMKLNCELSITAIEAKLYQVEDENTVSRIPLDSSCLNQNQNNFLVLDSVFHRIIYANFPLQLHPSDNDRLIVERDSSIAVALDFVKKLPHCSVTSRYVVTKQGHSQARYLVSMLIPVDVEKEDTPKGFWNNLFGGKAVSEYEGILTDEMSFDNYFKGIVKLIKSYRVESDY